MPLKTQPLQRRLVILEQRNFKHCANYQIFLAALPSRTAQNSSPLTQNSPQFRSTVPQGCNTQTRMQVPVPATPTIYPPLAPHRSQRASPSQVPYPRAAPRINPSDVNSPRATTTLPLVDVILITPHPAAENAPYVPQ
jgi:hypothetical protein